MEPEYTKLNTIVEVAVLQSRTPHNADEFSKEFPGLEGAFRHPVKVYWLFPEDREAKAIGSFHLKNLEIQAVPFTLVDPQVRSGNWEWLQDPFLVVPGPKPLFIIPAQASIQDQLIVLALARHSEAVVRMAKTYFEGGNALWFGGELMIGKDTILQNEGAQAEIGHWEIMEAVEKDFFPLLLNWMGDILPVEKAGCQPCSESLTYQPFFHLDLFLMPAGVNAKGIPRLAVASLEDSLTEIRSREGRRLAEWMEEQFEQIIQQVRKTIHPEVEIVRVPLLAHFVDHQPRVFTPCNGLYESTARGERVILPDYTAQAPPRYWLPRLRLQQDLVEKTWRSQGVQVEWMSNGFFENVEKCGALHCRIKIIRRQ